MGRGFATAAAPAALTLALQVRANARTASGRHNLDCTYTCTCMHIQEAQNGAKHMHAPANQGRGSKSAAGMWHVAYAFCSGIPKECVAGCVFCTDAVWCQAYVVSLAAYHMTGVHTYMQPRKPCACLAASITIVLHTRTELWIETVCVCALRLQGI